MEDDWGHDDSERTLLQLRECHVFRIPPRTNAAGHYAKDWGELSKPNWMLRCTITAKGEQLLVRLQHDDGRDFAVCKAGQGAIEPVVDSSRYFVLKIEDEKTGKHAFLGIGFRERSEAFDFNAAISDHSKHIRMEKEAAKAAKEFESRPKVDLSLQNKTITVSINISKPTNSAKQTSSGTGILAPPPSRSTPQQQQQQQSVAVPSDFSFDDDWGDFASATPSKPATSTQQQTSASLLGNLSTPIAASTIPLTSSVPVTNVLVSPSPIPTNVFQPSPPVIKANPLGGGFGAPGYVAQRPLQGSPQQQIYSSNAGSPMFVHPGVVPQYTPSFSSPAQPMLPLGIGAGSPNLQQQQRPLVLGTGSPLMQTSFPQSTAPKTQPSKDDPFANLVKF